MHPTKEEVGQKQMNKVLLAKPEHKKEAYREWNQGQENCEEYRGIV